RSRSCCSATRSRRSSTRTRWPIPGVLNGISSLPGHICGGMPGRRDIALSPLVVDVKADGAKQHQPLDHLLVVDADAEDGHAVVHDPHDHRAYDGAADPADAAIGRRAADEAGGDDVQLET